MFRFNNFKKIKRKYTCHKEFLGACKITKSVYPYMALQ